MAIGLTTLVLAWAAAPLASFEPEQGTLSGAATIGTDASASTGHYIKFGDSAGLPPGLSAWSNPATWGGHVPTAGEVVTIAAGQKVLLDTNSAGLGGLTVGGELYFDDTKDVKLVSKYVVVTGSGGKLQAGTATTPYQHNAVIQLTGGGTTESYALTGLAATAITNYNATHSAVLKTGIGTNVLAAMNGGIIDLHGRTDNDCDTSGQNCLTWTRLAATAAAGGTTLSLQQAVNWRAGDQLILASSTLDPFQSETVTVASRSADGKTITLTAPLANKHTSISTCFSNGGNSRCVDERSEVGLLTHNLKVTGPDDATTTHFGGHTATLAGGIMRLSNTEMYHLGQQGVLGRYPLHFHIMTYPTTAGGNTMTGDASASSITDVSLHDNFNRQLTIHGSNGLHTSGMVANDTVGHSVMLEDGFEEHNVLANNLVLGTRYDPVAAQRLRLSDEAPAEFWITNPNNDLTGNAAAGGQGAGIWYDFSVNSDNTNFAAAKFRPVGLFNNNVAHSHKATTRLSFSDEGVDGGTGISFDEYAGDSTQARPTFANNSAWMNAAFGMWMDGVYTLKDATAANNGVAYNAQDTAALGGLFVGTTPNTDAATVPIFVALARFYHGQADIDGAWLANFDRLNNNYDADFSALGDPFASSWDYTNRVRGLTFFSSLHGGSTAMFSDSHRVMYGRPYLDDPIPAYPYIDHDHWMADLDGSITNGSIGPALLSNFSGLLVPAAGQPADQTLYNWAGWYSPVHGAYGPLVQNGFDRSKIMSLKFGGTNWLQIRRDDGTPVSYGDIGAFAMGHAYQLKQLNGSDPTSMHFYFNGSEPGQVELYYNKSTKPSAVRSGYSGDETPYPEVACGSSNKNNTWCYDGSAKVVHLYLQISGTSVPFGQGGNLSSISPRGNTYWTVQ
ncbi:MAG TPA: G8 domain-containing protein [Candidatus Saccharimonadia bacterium]|nr:G8 domain-containing protein [Candidatus Saccharimonadia bacterium]